MRLTFAGKAFKSSFFLIDFVQTFNFYFALFTGVSKKKCIFHEVNNEEINTREYRQIICKEYFFRIYKESQEDNKIDT